MLDGRHRLRACLEVGVEPRFKTYEGDDPVRFVMRQETRRHLTVSQRAMMAQAFLPELQRQARERQGTRTDLTSPSVEGKVRRPMPSHESAEEAGQIVGVSRASVERASRVVREDPELAERVRAGEITVRSAEQELVRRPESDRPAVIAPVKAAADMGTRELQRALGASWRRRSGLSPAVRAASAGCRRQTTTCGRSRSARSLCSTRLDRASRRRLRCDVRRAGSRVVRPSRRHVGHRLGRRPQREQQPSGRRTPREATRFNRTPWVKVQRGVQRAPPIARNYGLRARTAGSRRRRRPTPSCR